MLVSCKYNLDSGCVELKYVDGSMISIDTIAVEAAVNISRSQRSELDWLIYNKPLEYARIVLDGNLPGYLTGTPLHGLEDWSINSRANKELSCRRGCFAAYMNAVVKTLNQRCNKVSQAFWFEIHTESRQVSKFKFCNFAPLNAIPISNPLYLRSL